jgi:hypothetical protein
MKGLVFFMLFLACRGVARTQDYNEYAFVDAEALQIPKEQTYSAATIARYVLNNFKTERERTRAVYSWVTANVRYSKDSLYHFRGWDTDADVKMSIILRRRKGVCENYAELFTGILLKCGIKSFMVSGYTRLAGTINYTAHGWSAVSIDNGWFLCDPTWDEAFRTNTRYFLLSPEDFIQTHFPFDPLWQLQSHPISPNEFEHGLTSSRDTTFFNYQDSVTAFLQSDSLQQLQAASYRIEKTGRETEPVKTWFQYNQMKIDIILHDIDRNLFNAAVADLNKAKSIFNAFVQYRNNEFKPTRPAAETISELNNVDSLIATAHRKMESIGKKVENYQYDTDALKINLNSLKKKNEEQKEFIRLYFLSNDSERQKLFYQ